MEVITEEKRTYKFRLTQEDILELIKRNQDIIGQNIVGEITSTEVVFTVPRGGDYSGMDIEIDNDNPITVLIETKWS